MNTSLVAGVDFRVGGAAEPCGIGASGLRARLADLQHELSVLGEFQHLAVIVAVAADPDKPLVVDIDAVFVFEPVVALSRPAPGLAEDCRPGRIPAPAAPVCSIWLRGGLKLAAFSSSVSERGRWMTQMWSCASTATPAACPMIQLFGSVFGHDASTWNFGKSSAKAGAIDSAHAKSDGTIFMSCLPDAGNRKHRR